MPSLASFGPTERPGHDRSTMKAVIPLCPLEKSALAKTTNRPASLELEIQHLVPSMTHSPDPSSHVALVLRAKASEPLPASVRQKLHTVSVQSRVRNLSFCSGVPYRMKDVISSVFWMSIMTATEGSTRATSSTARHAAVKPSPTPPYSSGASIAMRPCSKQAETMSGSMAALSSICRTRGARTFSLGRPGSGESFRWVAESWRGAEGGAVAPRGQRPRRSPANSSRHPWSSYTR
mmetsp:Transcript_5374/g.13758  ORF Transcript_5374/g.13758 Transcript_5374/m.13758 type:complete len:235 (-) Transcript_5374:455-1159(-)